MQHSKLINILKTFSKEEMKQFEKFLSSPFHNSVKNNIRMFAELKKFYPGFDNTKLSYEYLFQKIYPGKKFNKQMMWNLVSSMEKLAEEFLRQISLRRYEFESGRHLLWELGERKLLHNYLHTLEEIEKQFKKRAIDYSYFLYKEVLETDKQQYYHSMDKIKPMSDSKVKASEYQILLCLRMTVGGLNDMNVLSRTYNSKFDVNIPLEFAKNINLQNIVDYARSKNFEYTFLIEIYYHALMTILKPQEAIHFDKLRELYGIHFSKFSMSEKRAIMHWLVNYCNGRLELNEVKYARIIFELNAFRLKEGLAFYPDGQTQIPRRTYFQTLNSALNINEIEWAANFIRNYSSKLEPRLRKSLKAMAYALLHFQTKEYDKVLENLNNVKFFEIVDKLYARSLIARTYYETGEFESLLHYIDASMHFLAANPSIPDRDRLSYISLFNVIKKLISIKEHSDWDSITPLREAIQQMKIVEKRQWLTEKLDELEKQRL